MASVRPATAEAAKIITQLDAHKAGIKHNPQHSLPDAIVDISVKTSVQITLCLGLSCTK